MNVNQLHIALDYNRDTGVFRWKSPRPKIAVGTVAGTVTKKGSIRICLDGRCYYAHRLAWLYVHGVWPKHQIDHVNLNPSDNRIDNLREATNGQNGANKRRYATNKCGYKGVHFVSRLGKYVSQIKHKNCVIHLGCFDTPLEAFQAYCMKARELHGSFARAA